MYEKRSDNVWAFVLGVAAFALFMWAFTGAEGL